MASIEEQFEALIEKATRREQEARKRAILFSLVPIFLAGLVLGYATWQILQKSQELTRVNRELTIANQQLAEVKGDLARAKQELTRVNQQLTIAQQELATANEELATAEIDLENAVRELRSKQEELQKMEENLKSIQAKIDRAQSDLQALATESPELKDSLASSLQDLDSATSAIQAELPSVSNSPKPGDFPDNAFGIDISKWQGNVEWDKIDSDLISFVIIKATQGEAYVDEKFQDNWNGAKSNDFIRGAFHIFEPKADPVSQADHFLSQIEDSLQSTDLPPILTVEGYPQYIREQYEALSPSQRQNRILRCLRRLEERSGRKPIVNTDPASWRFIMGDSQALKDYPLWVAHFGVPRPSVPANNWGGNGWTFWQYSDQGRIGGITQAVDLDLFNGSYDDLLSFIASSAVNPTNP